MPEGNNERSTDVWQRVLRAALSLPGARIDRDAFLRKELAPHFEERIVNKAIEASPAAAGIPKTAIRTIALSCVAWHRTGVTALSFAVGIPGGWWMTATVPGDLGQFFWHIVVTLQKLAYLHGWPSLTDPDTLLDDETLHVFTLFVGVMFGAGGASKALGELSERLAAQVVKRFPQQALTKWGLYRLAREVAKWIGVKLTKQTLARWLSKAIPVISGFISGAITWISFSSMSRRLLGHLESLRLASEEKAMIKCEVCGGESPPPRGFMRYRMWKKGDPKDTGEIMLVCPGSFQGHLCSEVFKEDAERQGFHFEVVPYNE